ncbi:unnamed protein product [Ixodes hexagonus]
MTAFCTSPFWDWDHTWYSKYPRLTPCFENTVLTYAPALLLVPYGLSQWLIGRQKKPYLYRETLTWTVLSLSRFVASLLLTLTYAFSLTCRVVAGASSGASVTADLVHTITFAITVKVQQNHRKNGMGSSMYLFLFWLVTTVCKVPGCFRYFQEVFALDNGETDFSKLEFAVWVSACPMILLQFILSCWTDARRDARRPYLTASPVSFLLFGWMSPLILQKPQRCVQLDDIYSIQPDMMARRKYNEWNVLWTRELNSTGHLWNGLRGISRPMPSMFRSLWKVYRKPVVIACVLATLRAVLKTVPPLLLHLLMGYMGGNDPTWKGILYAFGIVSANFGSGLLSVHIDRIVKFTGLNIKTVMVAAVYRKTLRLSSVSQRDYAMGKLVNLISVDADRLFKLSLNFGYVASGVPLILIAVVILWQFLGAACLAGLAVLLIIIPAMALVIRIGDKYQVDQMKLKDKRLNTVAEMLSSVKFLKLFAWENIFISKCTFLRLEEAGLLKKYSYLTALSFLLLTCSSAMVSLTSFVAYLLISDGHILDPRTAFVSLTLFNHMQFPMFIIPDFISSVVQTRASMTRIQKFLLSPEVDDCSVGRRLNEGDAVLLKRVTASWTKDRVPVLRNINLAVKTGQLIAVVGPVGSGKSSLLSMLLGNLQVYSGSVDCIDGVAYAPQCPWIQNKTIRGNVIFTSTYDAELYDMVLKACCLERDLEMLPGGDLTEIGERGINLSGGQKQRVSLARAAYQKKDLYLFDDPLSAVDAHVGASIFKNLIGPRGMLKETTRILVTHNLSVLNEVDNIVVIQEGSVVECGTFQDLKREGSVLSELLNNFSNIAHISTKNQSDVTATNEHNGLGEGTRLVKLVDEETIEEGSISLQIYRTFIRQSGPLLIFVILFYAIYTAIGVFVGIWLSEWTNDSLYHDSTSALSLRTYRIEVYILLSVLQAVVNFLTVIMLWKVALSTSTTLHQLMLNGVMRAPMSFFDTIPSGRLMNRFGKDVDQLDVQLPTTAHYTLELLFLFASSTFLICINIPIYILIVVPVMACLLVLRQMYVVSLRQVKRLENVARSPVNNHFLETVSGLSSIRSYGVQGSFLRKIDDKINIMHTFTVNTLNFEFWIEVRMELAIEVLVFSMLLLLVTNRNIINTGTAGLLVSYTLNAVSSFAYFISYSSELEATLVSAERLDAYRRVTPERPWTSDLRAPPHWPGSGAISFKSYSTRYRDGLNLVLKDVDIDVSPGEKIGIVGRTGAGKSTFALSLFRIIEAAAGKIFVDDVDIAALGLHDLRSKITIIPQDPILFRGTLRFNLDPAGEHDTEELWSALDRSHLGDVFRDDGGLDFEVAEDGCNLSLGQRQLVCLARAVLRKTKILVLDEATASVDMRTELLVQQTLRDVMRGCTVLTIAHRLHTVLTSDRVVVMNQGRIVEVARPSELLADTTSAFCAMACEAGVVCHSADV